MKRQDNPEEWDKAKARQRMREHRADPAFVSDKVRNTAIRELIRRHREEFDAIQDALRDVLRHPEGTGVLGAGVPGPSVPERSRRGKRP